MEWIVSSLFNVVFAGVILIAGFLVASWARRLIIDLGDRRDDLDDTAYRLLGDAAKYAIIAATVIAVLARFGVATASLVAALAVAGLALGLAIQGALSHIAAGVMLMIFRPFKTGDMVEAGGGAGEVKTIGLMTTELATPDNVQVFIPNGAVWGGAIRNYSHYEERRIDISVDVALTADLAAAEAAIRDAIDDEDRAADTPTPVCKVAAVTPRSVEFAVRVWCDAADHWDLTCDLTRGIRAALDKAGLAPPAA